MGANDCGQLGDDPAEHKTELTLIKGMEKIKGVAAGNRYTMLFKEDGSYGFLEVMFLVN